MSGNQPTHTHTYTLTVLVYISIHLFGVGVEYHPKVTGRHVFKLTGFLHPHCVEDNSRERTGEAEGREEPRESEENGN